LGYRRTLGGAGRRPHTFFLNGMDHKSACALHTHTQTPTLPYTHRETPQPPHTLTHPAHPPLRPPLPLTPTHMICYCVTCMVFLQYIRYFEQFESLQLPVTSSEGKRNDLHTTVSITLVNVAITAFSGFQLHDLYLFLIILEGPRCNSRLIDGLFPPMPSIDLF